MIFRSDMARLSFMLVDSPLYEDWSLFADLTSW
jgi:hypothetical protein